MISDLIGQGRDKANDVVLDEAKKDIDHLKDLLAGPKREPIDIEKAKAKLVRGVDLGTPNGAAPSVPVKPTAVQGGAPPSPANVSLGRPIEIIHFGRVHRDVSRTFHAAAPTDDMTSLAGDASPGRAPYYRAALEREAVLLGSLTRAVTSALADKEQKEGSVGDLMKAAIDLVGGAGGTATSASSADMKPFLEKIGVAWDSINQAEIRYADLNAAGVKLHEVRAALTSYLLSQLGKGGDAPPAPKGILSDLPLVGELPIPGPVGQVIGTIKKVSGKLHDVQNAFIFGLTIAMQPAIEAACHQISIDVIQNGKSPIFPVWYAAELLANSDPTAEKKPFSALDMDDPLGGDLKKIGPLGKVNDAVHGAFGDANDAINSAVAKPLEIVDFLSKKVKPAPGHAFLDTAFQAATGPASALGGSEKLGEIAVAAFYGAIADEVPAFMHGFVETFVGYVFAVCVEFLRAVYRVLAGLEPSKLVSTDEMVAAGSMHVLTHLVDFATEKLGLDKLIEDHAIPIPAPPKFIPKGINWPEGKLSAAPIAAELKRLLLDKAAPYLKPVVEYAMSGLATRINRERAWAGPALTMEVHLGQLPTELALLFRDLFKPLWHFVDDTAMSVVSGVVAKALGPAAQALGVAGDGLGMASGFIADAQKKATQAQKFAKNVEDKAGALIKRLSSVHLGPGQTDDLDAIDAARKDLQNAVGADPFADDPASAAQKAAAKGASGFPANRKRLGQGVKVETADLAAVTERWADAVPESDTASAAQAAGGAK